MRTGIQGICPSSKYLKPTIVFELDTLIVYAYVNLNYHMIATTTTSGYISLSIFLSRWPTLTVHRLFLGQKYKYVCFPKTVTRNYSNLFRFFLLHSNYLYLLLLETENKVAWSAAKDDDFSVSLQKDKYSSVHFEKFYIKWWRFAWFIDWCLTQNT